MRLKEDITNYQARNVIYKNTRRDPQERSQRMGHSQRNKKRWCKGHVGIQHQYGFWIPGYGPQHLSWYEQAYARRGEVWAHRICENCGRIDHYCGKDILSYSV